MSDQNTTKRDFFLKSADTINIISNEEGTSEKKKHRMNFSRFINRTGASDMTFKSVLYFGFFMIILAAGIIGIALLLERNNFQSAHVVVGPQGPMGICNLSHSNQTFLISGNTIIESELMVGTKINVNDSFTIYNNDTCIVLNSTLPLCIPGGIKTNNISSEDGLNITINGQINTQYSSFFYGDTNIYQQLNIGGTSFVWNGTSLVLTGPSNIGTNNNFNLPGRIGNIGYMNQNGNCLVIGGDQCLIFNASQYISFNSPILGPFYVNGSSVFNNTIYVGQNNSNVIRFINGLFDFYSFSNPIRIYSPISITLNATSNGIINMVGNVSMNGTLLNTLNLSQNGLKTECYPGPQSGSLKFSSNCGCLSLTSTTGICLNASGSQGVMFNSNGNVTLNGSSSKLIFSNGATIGSSVNIQGNLTSTGTFTLTGDASINGNLNVYGNMTFNSLTVTGSSTFIGPIISYNTNNTFTNINVAGLNSNITISRVNTLFQGLGATFQSGTTLQVMSNLFISSNAAQLRCTSPIFSPNTPSNPNNFPCVPECTDMSRCSPTVSNLNIRGSLNHGTDYGYGPTNATFGNLGQRLQFFNVNADNIRFNTTNCFEIIGCLSVPTGVIVIGPITQTGGCMDTGCLHITGASVFDGDITSTGSNINFNTMNINGVLDVSSDVNIGGNTDVNGFLDVAGNILKNGGMHPCCSGLIDVTTVGPPTSSNTDKLFLSLGINANTTNLSTSESTIIPFNHMLTPTSKLIFNFHTGLHVFTAPADAMYAITVYLSMLPSDYVLGFHRGITLYKSFSIPSSIPATPIRICYQNTAFSTMPTLLQITCTYNGYFKTGDTFYVTASFDYAGPLTINGDLSGMDLPTRLEIYMF